MIRRPRLTVIGASAAVLVSVVLALLVLPNLFAPNEQLFFGTEKPSYPIGDNVSFVFRNGGEEEVTLPSPAPWTIDRELNGTWQRVEYHLSPAMLVTLAPGENASWVWKAATQTDYPSLAEVGPGPYQIRLSASVHGEFRSFIAYFTLTLPVRT